MIKKITLCFALFLFGFQVVTAQKILLEDSIKDFSTEKYGPNLKKFRHLYYSMEFFADQPSSNAPIKYGLSHTILIGIRYKRKLSEFFAIGYDISYQYLGFNLKQKEGKKIPNAITHEKEKMLFNNGSFELYNRFNFGKRGNLVGNFIDLGAYADASFSITHYTRDTLGTSDPTMGNKIIEVTRKKLDYTNWYHYGVRARLGFGRYVIAASYRISDLMKSRIGAELPRLSVGLQIGFHK